MFTYSNSMQNLIKKLFCIVHILEGICRRPKIKPTTKSTTNQPLGNADVEVVKPRLTEAGLARWRQVQKEASNKTVAPITIRPKLLCSVKSTPSGRIITIEGGYSDCEDDLLH